MVGPAVQHSAAVKVFGQPIALAGVVTAAVVLLVSAVLALALRKVIIGCSTRQGRTHRATWCTA